MSLFSHGIFRHRDFSVLYFGDSVLRGITLKILKNDRICILASAEKECAPEHRAEGLAELRKMLNCTRENVIFLTGGLREGIFFRTATGNIAPKLVRDAVRMELGEHLLKSSPETLLQCALLPAEEEAERDVLVYAFPVSARHQLEILLREGLGKADGYLYPFAGSLPGDPLLWLPETEKDFAWDSREWVPVPEGTGDLEKAWKECLQKDFDFPPDFPVGKFLPCLIPARFIASEGFSAQKPCLEVLNSRLRPARFRTQLIAAGVLFLLLLLLKGSVVLGDYSVKQRQFQRLQAEKRSLQRQITQAKARLKTGDKAARELSRAVQAEAGETALLRKLSALSSVLPKNVMIQSFRLNESSLDLTLRSEAESLNLPDLIRPLGIWKVTSVRQFRRGNEAAGSVVAKLELLKQEGGPE